MKQLMQRKRILDEVIRDLENYAFAHSSNGDLRNARSESSAAKRRKLKVQSRPR